MSLFNLYVTAAPQKTKSSPFKLHCVRIENTGIEFRSQKDKSKFLQLLSKASAIEINDRQGLTHKSKEVKFGIYEREQGEAGVRCEKCKKEFHDGTCSQREYEYIYSYNNNGLSTTTDFICDCCLSSIGEKVKEVKIQNAKEKKELGVS